MIQPVTMTEPTFEQFSLDPSLVENLKKHNFVTPTPVQANAIPLILEGKDILAQAETGSGKTGAFVIPMLQKLMGKEAMSSFSRIMTLLTKLLGTFMKWKFQRRAHQLWI